MPELSQVVGASAQDPNVETNTTVDGSIRFGIMTLIQVSLALATAFGLDWTAEQVGAVMAFASALVMLAFLVIDKVIAARSKSVPASP